jgi:arabinogalactan endo-1,4-beta-galactosidase
MEAAGRKFYNSAGQEKECMDLVKSLGMNTIRLRVWVNPAAVYNATADVVAKAVRAKNLGMRIMIDFHYSDTWADPGKQYKPAAWRGKSFPELKQAVYDYTKEVMQALKEQGTLPDMVQVGNEINHGMIWPEGGIGNLDSLAQLIYAGINAVKAVAPATTIMLHVALGGQNDESL